MIDVNLTTPQAVLVGAFLPFVGLGLLILGVLGKRWIARTVMYAKPKYLERRINIAASIIDARRAYVLGGRSLALSLTVGRQWRHHEQARAVLLDEFVPIPADARSGGTP